jgi:hypothetical protein
MKQAGKLGKSLTTNPSTLLHFQLIMITHESSSYQVFYSFYQEVQSEFPISYNQKPVPLTS